MKQAVWLLALLLTALSPALQAERTLPDSLHLAAADWCPYSCDSADHPGAIAEAVTELLATQNITLKVSVLPWTRAIKLAELGKVDGLLTAIESEVPQLRLTSPKTGEYQVCLFTEASHHFLFHDRNSFSGLTVGVIQDYGYGEPLDSIIENPSVDENVYTVTSSRPLHSLVEMTLKGRIDTFAEDSLVLANYLKQTGKSRIKNVGCLTEIPFYTAISPAKPYHETLIKTLNTLFASDEYASIYAQAMQRYGHEGAFSTRD